MDHRAPSPRNDRVAMVLCPKWGSVPPIALAYIKGAVRRRSVRCFDFNRDLLERFVPDHLRGFNYDAYCRDIVPFMFRQPDFKRLDDVCDVLARKYAPIIDQWVDQLKDYGIVGFSVYQENLVMSVILARRLRREHGIVCLAGGPSMNMDERVFLRHLLSDGTFDIGVLGTAEDVIDELLDRIIAGKDLADLPGLAMPGTDERVSFTPAKRVNLDRFSPPDYGDFDLAKYPPTSVYIYAVVGCVGRCEFCTIHEFYPGYFHKPVEQIQKEMLFLHERHGRNEFFFSDGMFLGNKKDAMAMFDFAIAHNFKLGLQIRVLPYWDDEELVGKASQCVSYLQIGFESASPNVRKAMGKMIDADRTKRIFQLFYRHKLPIHTNIIIGYPNESDDDFEDTYRFLDEYLLAEHRHVGTNIFFIPNGFPREKYNIHTDGAGHWASDHVDFYDRIERASRFRQLAKQRGRPWNSVYDFPAVEGVPIDGLSPSPEELREIRIDRYVEAKDASVGYWEHAALADRYLQVSGWAKLPDSNEPGREILLLDPEKRIVARAAVGEYRPDVADCLGAKSLQRSGWAGVVRRGAITCRPEKLRAYLYTADDRTAWQLVDSSLVVQTKAASPAIAYLRRTLARHLPPTLARHVRAVVFRLHRIQKKLAGRFYSAIGR